MRRWLLTVAGLLATTGLACAQTPAASSRRASSTNAAAAKPAPARRPPNLIFIVADNLNASLTGPYGNRQIRTPNLDALAARGTTFDNAYAVNGVCSPTRATLLTGLLPSQNGVHNALPSSVGIKGWSAVGEFRTLPQTLAARGYSTALIGKYHLGDPDKPQLGFDRWITDDSGHTTSFHDVEVLDNGRRYVVRKHLTDFWADKAIEFVRTAPKDRPFFLYLTFNGPYNLPPVVLNRPDNRFADYYSKHTPDMPQLPVHPYLKRWAIEAQDPAKGDPMAGWRIKEDEGKSNVEKALALAWGAIGALNNRTAMINVASETAMVDDAVGRLMADLRKRGLDDDTIVVFTSDQGAAYGQHGLFGNSSWASPEVAFDENMKVPFIMAGPNTGTRGRRTDVMMGQYDVMPTLLDLVGYGDVRVDHSPGSSILPAVEGKSAGNDAVFYEYTITRAIRTREWKYIKRFGDEPAELYHLTSDPGEDVNLVDDPGHAKIRETLSKRIDAFFNRYADRKYDDWKGGTAKATLRYGGDNRIYQKAFPAFKGPIVEALPPFREPANGARRTSKD